MLYSLSINLNNFVDFLIEGQISLFISGFIFTLSLYHFLLFFQHKDKSYLYYSLYTLLTFIYLLNKTSNYFLSDLVAYLDSFLVSINISIQWAIFIVYLQFARVYINLKKANSRWNTIMNYVIIIQITILLIISFYAYYTQNTKLISNIFYPYIAPLLFPIGVVFLFVIAKFDNILKYYIILGSGIYLFLATVSLIFIFTGIEGSLLPFYLAVIIENIFFALGLGAKQKKIQEDKNNAQQTVIEGQRINLDLQKEIKIKLDQEVALQTERIIQLTQDNKKEQKRKLALEYSKQTLDLRMRALQTQMNPHFLFNSLNSIKHFIIKNNKEDATYFLSKLSMFIRKILDSSRLKEITLQEEVSIMQLYLEVENIRLKKRIQFDIDIAKDVPTETIKIPPLVLQPFIENAIWHGLALKKGLKKITMNISIVNRILKIQIIDNGIGRHVAAQYKAAKLVEKESQGINLTKERLIAFTSHKTKTTSITFEDLFENKLATGTIVMIQIPM